MENVDGMKMQVIHEQHPNRFEAEILFPEVLPKGPTVSSPKSSGKMTMEDNNGEGSGSTTRAEVVENVVSAPDLPPEVYGSHDLHVEGERFGSPVRSVSSDSTSDEDSDNFNEFESNEIMWEREVMPGKAMTVRTNVLQIPRDVIMTCLFAPQDSIELFDTDMEQTYVCELKERESRGEKYLCRGWYEFASARDLSDGDVLCFCIRYPPASRILVSVERP